MKFNCIDPRVLKPILDSTSKNTSKDSSLLEKIIDYLESFVLY